MPGGFPAGVSICNPQSIAALTASSKGTTITASGSTNTKGTYTSLITSTTYDCCYVTIQISSSTAALILVDIAIGAGGSQQVIIPNIFTGATVGSTAMKASMAIAVPIAIPAGTNIWARSQSATASAACFVNMQLFEGEFSTLPGVAGYDDLGTTLATSLGTLVTPSATAQVLGTWTSLVTATARDYIGIFGIIGLGTAAGFYLTNIGIGPNAPATTIIPNWASFNINAVAMGGSTTLPFLPIQIPLGTDVWAQNQTYGTSSAGQSIILYGAYQ